MLSASDLAAGCTVTSECLAVLIRDGVPPPPQASPPGSPLLTPWQQLGEKVDIVKVLPQLVKNLPVVRDTWV